MKISESLINLGKALAQFNAEIQKISQDARNPQFRSKYVTLDALIDATKPILQKNGLSVLQFPLTSDSGKIGIKSMLLHSSGEYIESDELYMQPVRMIKGGEFVDAVDPQAAGSTISYLRRYSYQAILNLSTGEDDDGNKGSGQASNATGENIKESSTDRQTRREDINTTNTQQTTSNKNTNTTRRSRRNDAESEADNVSEQQGEEPQRRSRRRRD